MSLSSQNGGLASEKISFHAAHVGIVWSADKSKEMEAGRAPRRFAWGTSLPGQESRQTADRLLLKAASLLLKSGNCLHQLTRG
jgi:hypothetical protein